MDSWAAQSGARAASRHHRDGIAALAPLPESPGDHITIRISSFRSSYVVDAGHCYDEITKMMTEELNAAHAGEKITSLIGDGAPRSGSSEARVRLVSSGGG